MGRLCVLALVVAVAGGCSKAPQAPEPEAGPPAPAAPPPRDERDVEGGLVGTEAGELEGGYGFGTSGSEGAMRDAGMGTIGRGHGAQPPAPPMQPMRLGDVSASEGLDRAIVRRYLRQKLRQVNGCYEQRLAVQPALRGTLQIALTFGPDGLVTSAQVTGIADDALLACTTQVFRSMVFPKPNDGKTVGVAASLVLGATP